MRCDDPRGHSMIAPHPEPPGLSGPPLRGEAARRAVPHLVRLRVHQLVRHLDLGLVHDGVDGCLAERCRVDPWNEAMDLKSDGDKLALGDRSRGGARPLRRAGGT